MKRVSFLLFLFSSCVLLFSGGDEAAPQEDMAEVVQELALIQRVFPAQYFPDPVVIQKGTPVKFYITTIQREHQNKVSVEPFFVTSEPVVPGKTRATLFTPEEAGEFTILNLGHGFTGKLFVMETVEQVLEKRAEKGFQEFSLLYGAENLYPQKISVQKDVPVKLYNIGLREEHLVSLDPFLEGAQTVIQNDVTTFEFVPDRLGTFALRDETFNLTAELVVELGPPIITSIVPTRGPLSGRQKAALEGSGFLAGATVTIGGVQATDVVVTPTRITFTIPPGTEGPKAVLVRNVDGKMAFVEDGYAYVNVIFSPADLNADGVVNILDLVLVASEFGRDGENLRGDVNNDQMVNVFDLVSVASRFGERAVAAAPEVE